MLVYKNKFIFIRFYISFFPQMMAKSSAIYFPMTFTLCFLYYSEEPKSVTTFN